jgi:tellurite resistance protein TerC
MDNNLINHPGVIVGFAILVLVMLLLDLGVFNKKVHAVTSKEAAIWSVVWISLSMAFSAVIY